MKNLINRYVIIPLLGYLMVGCSKEFAPIVSTRNEIVKFSILSTHSGTYTDPNDQDTQRPNFIKDVQGVIYEDKIIVLAPYYAKTWDGLKPTFVHSDRAIVYIGDNVQDSGVSEVDFTNPVTYRVVSEDGQEKTYAVEFYKEKPFVSYAISMEDNPELPYDSDIEIDSMNRVINVVFRKGISLTDKIARFVVPEDVSVSIAGKPQVSGESVIDLTNPVTYTLSLSDDNPETWIVNASLRDASSEADFLTFNFSKAKNPELLGDLVGEIDRENKSIRVASYWTAGLSDVPLTPDFTTSKYVGSVTCNGVEQTSGRSIADFSKTVTYTITADDGSNQDWDVTFYKPAKFYIKDRNFRELLKSTQSDLLDGDSLIISKAIANPLPDGTEWWGDGLRNPDLPIQDLSGIEFFQAIPTLGIPGVQLGSNVLDLRKNIGLTWLVYWNADIDDVDISGLPGDANGVVLIQITSGKKISRLRARHVKELNFLDGIELSYLDYRGNGVNNFSNDKVTFARGAKLLMTKNRWEEWVASSNPCVGVVQNAPNLTLELWSDDNKQLLETKKFVK